MASRMQSRGRRVPVKLRGSMEEPFENDTHTDMKQRTDMQYNAVGPLQLHLNRECQVRTNRLSESYFCPRLADLFFDRIVRTQ